MRVSSSLLLTALACLVLAAASLARAAPLREAPADPYAGKPIRLSDLDKNAGARFGTWGVWRYDEGGSALLLVHDRGMIVYLPWSSNGWLNYRDVTGQWYVLLSQGKPDVQKRDDLQITRFVGQRPAAVLAPGRYLFERWAVTVRGDALEFENTAPHNDRMTIRPFAPGFTHNGRLIDGQ